MSAKSPFNCRAAAGLALPITALLAGAAGAQAPSLPLARSFEPPLQGGTLPQAAPFGAFVAEAAARFGVPEAWISAVMRVESALHPRAVSPKGAMGLMQLMPSTWAELRARLALGGDPFDPHDNIFAGAAYLRALYDAFGLDGMLAAYNAGPARYLDYRDHGHGLPDETRRYVAELGPLIDPHAAIGLPVRPPPTLFVALPVTTPPDPAEGTARAASATPRQAAKPPGGLFAGPWSGTAP